MILATGLSGTIGKHMAQNVLPFRQDITKNFEVSNLNLLENVQAMIHMAGKVGIVACEKSPQESYDLNYLGTLRLGKAVLEESEGRFIFISSSHVYASQPWSLTEQSLLNPQSTYAKHKLMAEDALRSLFEHQPHRLTILRVFSVLDWNTAEGSLGATITRLLHKRDVVQIQNSEDIRDFLTPETIAHAIFQVAKNNRIFGILNVSSSRAISIKEACIKMASLANLPLKYLDFRPQQSHTPRLVGDNSLIRSLLPNVNLDWIVGKPNTFL